VVEAFSVPPVLLIAWRRPSATKMVLEQIRKAAPSRLYIACDGPSIDRPGENDKVLAVREIIKKSIDWPCEVFTLYSDINQGCRLGVVKAINWFFENEDEGIILEDDCVPHSDFFVYCADLLERYRNDQRIWWISGTNAQNGHWRGDASYYISKYGHCWGWASWRSRWANLDSELSTLPAFLNSGLFISALPDPKQRQYWANVWTRLRNEGVPDAWDYRWTYSCISNGGLAIVPNRMLVSNVGFDSDATHTKQPYGQAGSYPSHPILPLSHPSFLLPDVDADSFTFKHLYNLSFLQRLLIKLSRLRLFIFKDS